MEYAIEVEGRLKAAGFRASVDSRYEKVGRKIRDAEIGKYPYMLIVGEQEVKDKSVAVRKRKEGNQGTMVVDEFISYLDEQLAEALA